MRLARPFSLFVILGSFCISGALFIYNFRRRHGGPLAFRVSFFSVRFSGCYLLLAVRSLSAYMPLPPILFRVLTVLAQCFPWYCALIFGSLTCCLVFRFLGLQFLVVEGLCPLSLLCSAARLFLPCLHCFYGVTSLRPRPPVGGVRVWFSLLCSYAGSFLFGFHFFWACSVFGVFLGCLPSF